MKMHLLFIQFLIIACSFLIFQKLGFCQVKAGLKIGTTLSTPYLKLKNHSTNPISTSKKVGYSISVPIDFRITKNFSFQLEPSYLYNTNSINGGELILPLRIIRTSFNYDLSTKNLELPLLIKYNKGIGKGSLSFFIGPSLNLILDSQIDGNGRNTIFLDDGSFQNHYFYGDNRNINSSLYSLNIHVGLVGEFSMGQNASFLLELRYRHGLTPIYFDPEFHYPVFSDGDDYLNDRNIICSVGYRFLL